MIIEPLDFCRVKKIDEKGYGFLKSLYYPNDIFFHFSQIKKEDFLSKLQEMKRGEFFLFFTSFLQSNGKRKASKIWYSLDQVPPEYFPTLTERVATEFEGGKINLFDLLYVFDGLKKLGFISHENLISILSSKKIELLPTTILPYLSPEEIAKFKEILKIEELRNKEPKPSWFEDIEKA
jgi:cold shock CspA family protein